MAISVRATFATIAIVIGLTSNIFAGDTSDSILGEDGTIYGRMSNRDFAQALTNGLQPIDSIDYGSFVWLKVTQAGAEKLRADNIAFDNKANTFEIDLGGFRFDPLTAVPKTGTLWDGKATVDPDLHLVQFVGPTRVEWLQKLKADGLQIVSYIHPFTYVVWGNAASKQAAGNAKEVRWTGSFLPAYRVLPKWRNLDKTMQDFDVLVFRGADSNQVIQDLILAGAQVRGRLVLNDKFEEIGITLPGTAIQAAAEIPGVYSIQTIPTDGGLRGEMSNQVNVNNVDGTNAAFPGYQAWLTSVGLNGSGVVIANVDGGVLETHPDLVNRFLSCTGTTCGGSAIDAHGTHTSGIMAADGSSGTLDSFGFLRGLGVAPGANLVEQLYSPFFQNPGGMLQIMTDSYNNGAFLSGNSWGPAGSPRGYDNDTLQVDIGVRDADPNAAGNQPLFYTLSFMNGNGGTSTQGTPDEAKNIFTIGSTKMQTGSGQQILDIDDISSNSAHGPALDGRIIPHMVAPGCNVDSTITSNSYGLFCGTSMASPHVSGAVALFVEYYRSFPGFTADPSAALIKAAFTVVARDLAGNTDADGFTLGHPFDSKQGWGRMDLEEVVSPASATRYFDNPMVFDNTGEQWSINIEPADPLLPMKIMLVWTDAPGHGLGGSTPAWNNDLDLVVEAGANTYLGNNFGATGWSVTGGTADGMNNTEGVFLEVPSSVTLRVIASNVNSDGIPTVGDATDQDFAVVCYNCAEEPGFRVEVNPDSAAVCTPDDAVFNVDVVQILGFIDPVTLSASGEPAGTSVSFGTNPVTPPSATTMTITNTGSAVVGDYTVTVTGTSATKSSNTTVELAVFDSIPTVATLITPTNGAIEVSVTPVYTWGNATQASGYDFELATDAGFNNIIVSASGLTDATFSSGTPLIPANVYFWRVRASNPCGTSNYSSAFSFSTRLTLPILLVDDDDNGPDVRSSYAAALANLGEDFDVWDTANSDNEPDAATLAQYSAVVWFTGDEFGGASGPGAAGESALATYLDAGGCLFMSSQDYYFDRGLTSFIGNYLGVASATSDVSQVTATGTGSVFAGFGPFTLVYPFSNFSDIITPTASAELAFSGNAGDAAVTKDNGVYRTIFWGFPWESIGSAIDRETLMATVLTWCDGSSPTAIEPPLAATGFPHGITKDRYLSFVPNSLLLGTPHAYRVTHVATGVGWYASTPRATPPGVVGLGLTYLVNDAIPPLFDFATLPVAHTGGCMVAPGENYEIQATLDGVNFSTPLAVATTATPTNSRWWCDVVGSFSTTGDASTMPPTPLNSWSPPNGAMNGFDITAILRTFDQDPTAPHISQADVNPEIPDRVANGNDVLRAVNAFATGSGMEFYPFAVPSDPGPQGQGPCDVPPPSATLSP